VTNACAGDGADRARRRGGEPTMAQRVVRAEATGDAPKVRGSPPNGYMVIIRPRFKELA
jgi:hypothetical protein